MTKLTKGILNKHGWFYAGEPQVKTNFVNGGNWLRFYEDYSPTKGTLINIGIEPTKNNRFMVFAGWVNTEEKFLEILDILDLDRYSV